MKTQLNFIITHYKKSSEMLSKITYLSNASIYSDNNSYINYITSQRWAAGWKCGCCIRYATKKWALTYLGIVQSVTEEDKCHIIYLKRSGGKTFSLKEGDIDIVDANNILAVLTNFSVNSSRQYIVDTSFILVMWRHN